MIDQLTLRQKQQVKQYIDHQPDMLWDEINTVLAEAQPTPLQAGTMDMNHLLHAVHDMWDGLGEDDIESIICAMNEETIKSE